MKKCFIIIILTLGSTSLTWSQWQQINQPTTDWILSIGSKDSILFAGTWSYGVFNSHDKGATWSSIDTSVIKARVVAFEVNGDNIFIGTQYAGVYLSNNIGNNWIPRNNGLFPQHDLPNGAGVTGLAAAVDMIYLSSEEDAFASSDNGYNWVNLSDPVYDNGLPQDEGIECIGATGSMIYAGTFDYGLYISNDKGQNWTHAYIENGLPFDASFKCIAVSGSRVLTGTNYGLYLSIDSGSNWTEIYKGLNGHYLFNTMMQSGTNIFAGSDSGIFVSANGGNSWLPMNQGLDTEIVSIAIAGSDIYACTVNGMLWRRSLFDILSCTANFSIYADAVQLHHYFINNKSFGKGSLKYDWDWGDNTHDTIPYPNHVYTDEGFYDICLTITDTTGCTNTYCDSSFHAMRSFNTMVYVDVLNPSIVTATNASKIEKQDLIIYPSPAKNKLTIQTSEMKNVKRSIYNMLGKLLYQSETRNPQSEVDISNLSSGLYFLELQTEKGNIVKKFVKE